MTTAKYRTWADVAINLQSIRERILDEITAHDQINQPEYDFNITIDLSNRAAEIVRLAMNAEVEPQISVSDRVQELLKSDAKAALESAIPTHEGRQICSKHNFWRSAIEDDQTCPICGPEERESFFNLSNEV